MNRAKDPNRDSPFDPMNTVSPSLAGGPLNHCMHPVDLPAGGALHDSMHTVHRPLCRRTTASCGPPSRLLLQADHCGGDVLPASVRVLSNSVIGGKRTVVLT